MRKDIMIVDDSPAMRAFIRRTVLIGGLDVGNCLEAGNGKEALDQLGRHLVDVILTDINMPIMDGEQFVQELRRSDRLCRIPVVVISTDSTQSKVLRFRSLVVHGYLCKPFRPEELAHLLRDAIPGWGGQAREDSPA